MAIVRFAVAGLKRPMRPVGSGAVWVQVQQPSGRTRRNDLTSLVQEFGPRFALKPRNQLMLRPMTVFAMAHVAIYALGFAIVLHATADAATFASDAVTSSGPCVMASANLPPAPSAGPTTETAHLDNGDTITAAAGDVIVIQRDPMSGSYAVGVVRGQK